MTSSPFAGHTLGEWRWQAGVLMGPDGYGIARMVEGTATPERYEPNRRILAAAPALLAERDALRKALEGIEDAVGMACVEIDTPIIGKITNAQMSRVRTALDVARRALSDAKGGGAST